MAGVNVKMGVSGIADFKRNIGDAEAAIKNLDTQLKLNEQQFKQNGDQAMYMHNKLETLKSQLVQQERIVSQCEAALKTMKDNGVDESSKSYQNMEEKMYGALLKLWEMRSAFNEVEKGGTGAASGIKETDEQLKQIKESRSWEDVAEGLGKLRNSLERTGRAVINFSKKMYGYVKNSAEWADDLKTEAASFQVSVEELQAMRNVADIIDTDVDTIIKARRKLSTNIGKGQKGTMELLDALGISYNGNMEDTFWAAGEAIMAMSDETEQNAAATQLFGKSWSDLIPLFAEGRKSYEELMEIQKDRVLSEEDVNKLGEADDKIKQIEQELERMKNQFVADNANTILSLMQFFLDHSGAIITAIVLIGGAMKALKLAEAAANVGRIVNGLNGLRGGNGTPAADASGASGGGVAASGGEGFFAKAAKGVKSLGASAANSWGLMGGASTFAPLAAMIAAGYAGYRMIDANLNDANLNQVYGNNAGEGNILETMSAKQAQLAYEYWKIWSDESKANTDEAYDAYDRLYAALEEGGVENANLAMGLIEDAFRDKYNENLESDLVPKLDAMIRTVEETNDNTKNGLKSSDVALFKTLPAAIQMAVQNGMSGATVVIGRDAVAAIGGMIGENLWTQLTDQLH